MFTELKLCIDIATREFSQLNLPAYTNVKKPLPIRADLTSLSPQERILNIITKPLKWSLSHQTWFYLFKRLLQNMVVIGGQTSKG